MKEEERILHIFTISHQPSASDSNGYSSSARGNVWIFPDPIMFPVKAPPVED